MVLCKNSLPKRIKQKRWKNGIKRALISQLLLALIVLQSLFRINELLTKILLNTINWTLFRLSVSWIPFILSV